MKNSIMLGRVVTFTWAQPSLDAAGIDDHFPTGCDELNALEKHSYLRTKICYC